MGRARSPAAGESFAACLGAVLRRLRWLRHLSQDELGRLAGYDGSYVGAVERAAVRPSRALVAALDRALDAAGGLLAVWRLADQEWDARAALAAAGDPWPADRAVPAPAGDALPAVAPAGGAPGGATVAGPAAWTAPPGGAAVAGPAAGTAPGEAAGSRSDAVVEAMELARLAEASDVGADALASVERAVGRLRGAAASAPPGSLLPAVRAQRRYVGRLLDGRLTVAQRRRLLTAAGWLSVVLARLHFEAGERDAAEASRDAALRLARQAGDAELAAWVLEAAAWWALVDGRLRDAIELARAGQDRAPPASSAAVQLALHEAQAWRQLGDPAEAEGALRQAALLRGMLPGMPPGCARVE
jgi:transcriptional regulator with XRE-family HTH domain